MKKNNIIIIFVLSVLLQVEFIFSQENRSSLKKSVIGLEKISLQEIHEVLFELYFPDSAQLSTTEKKQRIVLKEQVWQYLQTKPECLALLDQLQLDSIILPKDIKLLFFDVVICGPRNVSLDRITKLQYALRRHKDNNVRKFASRIRQLYNSIIYSGLLTLKIAGDKVEQNNISKEQLVYDLPASQLILDDNVIRHVAGDIDYLIIGSGPAGSLIAHELVVQKPGARVVLIDSGSLIIPGSVVTESSSEFMESNNMRTTVSGGINIRNGKAFGGGTIVNLDLAFSPLLPEIQSKITSWIDHGYIPESLIHENNNDWQKLEKAYGYVCCHIGTRKVEQDEINDNNRILLEGSPTATTYNLNAQKLSDSKKITKISALDAFIIPAVNKGLQIIPDIKVNTIEYEKLGNQMIATGVVITFEKPLDKDYCITNPNKFGIAFDQPVFISAKNIIISSGTLGSAEILLRSNIANNNIGCGIVMHPSMGIYGRFNKEIDALSGVSASVYAPSQNQEDGYFFESMSATPNFIPLINHGSGKQILDLIRDSKYLGGFGIMLVDGVSKNNRVFLDSRTNKIEVDYTISSSDKIRFRKALKEGLEILFQQGAYEVYIPSCEPLLSDSNEYIPLTSVGQIAQAIDNLQFIENENVISSAHMQGSNKIGNDPNASVVSHNFKVWDQSIGNEFENLYVCDSSIFPTSIGANPMQSIYTFAKLFVDQLCLK